MRTPDALDAVREIQTAAADAVDDAWNKAMMPAIKQIASKPPLTAAAADDAGRKLQRAAKNFVKSKELSDLVGATVDAAYRYGVLHIWNRYIELENRRKRDTREDLSIRPVQKGAPSALSKITGAVNLTLADKNAVEQTKTASFNAWVTNDEGTKFTTPFVRTRLAARAKELVTTGASSAVIGDKLKSSLEAYYGVGEFAGRSRSYWGGVVEHVASEAGIRGQVAEMGRLGFTRYEVVNPMDERTTPCCALINGKTLIVEHAAAQWANVDAAQTPDEIKSAKPFLSGGKTDGLKAVVGMTAGPKALIDKDSKALADAGLGTPPYHFRCRSYLDVFYEEGEAPVPVVKPIPPSERVEAAPSTPVGFPHDIEKCRVHELQPGGANPKFVLEAPDGSLWMFKDYSTTNSYYRANVDELAYKIQKAAGIQAPETHILTIDKNWSKWGAENLPPKLRGAHNATGSVTRMFTPDEMVLKDLGGNVGGVNIEILTRAQAMDIQLDHAVNWLISNGDAHYENFLGLSNGRVVGIDKGQGFKYFGNDRLAWNYRSQQAPVPHTNGFAYAESQLTRYAEGKMPSNYVLEGVYDSKGKLTELGKSIQAMQNFPDEAYAATIRPYVEAMVRGRMGVFGKGTVDEGLAKILARKNSLLKDYDDFYKRLEAARREALGIVDLTKEARFLAKRNLWENADETIKAIEAAKAPGYTMITGSNNIEDMVLHGSRYARPGVNGAQSAQYQLRGRLRPAASARMKTAIDRLLGGSPASRPSAASVGPKSVAVLKEEAETRIYSWWTGSYTSSDPADTGVFRFIKSFNVRHDAAMGHQMLGQEMGKYEQIYDAMIAKFNDLSSLTTAAKRNAAATRLGYAPTAAEVKVAEDYLKLLRPYKLADGTWNVENVASKIGNSAQPNTPTIIIRTPKAPKVPEPEVAPTATEQKMTARKMTASEGAVEDLGMGAEGTTIKREWGTEEAKRNITNLVSNSGQTFSNVDGYVVNHASNPDLSIRFFSHNSGMRQYQGDFRIVINKAAPTVKDIAEARAMLAELGVDLSSGGATVEEMKVVWARKQARVVGLDLDASTAHIFTAVSDDLPPKEQLEKLAKAFDAAAEKTGNVRLKWNSLTKGMADEDYLPVFDGHLPINGKPNPAGHGKWTRRDITVQDLKDAGIHGGFTDITGGMTPKDLVGIMTSSDNVAMMSTAERARAGIPWAGSMSPVKDMTTGGANYVFTRVRAETVASSGKARTILGETITDGIEAKIRSGALNPASDTVPIKPGMYWKRETLLDSDGIFYGFDRYGNVESPQAINQYMGKTMTSAPNPATSLHSHMKLDATNEFIPKHELGLSTNLEHWVLNSHRERTEVLQILKDKGITEFGGRPVEHIFLVGG